VTLAGTYWRSGPATPENEAAALERLRASQDRLAPFDLLLGGIESFLPEAPVIYLGVQATPELLEVRRVLTEALGSDKHTQRDHFSPHLTLAMKLSLAATEALYEELRRSEWHTGCWRVPVRQLQLMQRGPPDPAWRCIRTIPLQKPAAAW
jgi:2'-5' RNA ligase